MAGYIRVDTSNNIADGNVIAAADLDNEFNGVQDAFSATTGHTHGGAVGEGAPIVKLGPSNDVTISNVLLAPKTTNTVDLGSSALRYKDLYLAGNASIAGTLGVTGVATFTAQPILSSLTASRAVFSDGSKGLVSNAITGTGNVVMSTSPTLVTPDLGTPSALVGTNITGTASGLTAGNVTTNANLTGAITSTGNATVLGSFTSANLAGALTDETGSGSAVFATSPTLVTPILGTPTSGNFSSGTFTWPTFNQNTTGTAANVTGTVAVANGGSGQTTAAAAITALTGTQTSGQYLRSNGTAAALSAIQAADVPTLNQNTTGTAANVTGTVAVANGGTGLTSGTSGGVLYYSATGTLASSAALAANALVVGGGAGVTPATVTTGSGVLTALAANANAAAGVVTGTGTATLQNKRIDPRVVSTTTATTLTPDVSAADQYAYTALASGLTINAPTGTPVDGDKLIFRLLDNGTTRALTWNATYTVIGTTLPTATTASKMIYVGCIYNAANTRWDVIAVTTQA